MREQYFFEGGGIPYTLSRSWRSRQLRIAVYPGGRVRVSAPKLTPRRLIEKFIEAKKDWLVKSVEQLKSVVPVRRISRRQERTDFLQHKEAARRLIMCKLGDFNRHYRFSYGRVSIRSQSTRWGSCSRVGNLNFNYKLVQLPETLVDLVVVHELCHLAEFNHSDRFWARVAETIPDYKIRRRELKKISINS